MGKVLYLLLKEPNAEISIRASSDTDTLHFYFYSNYTMV